MKRVENEIQQAFTRGDPAAVWEAVQDLLAMSRSLHREAGRARFQANFGSELCESCEGLQAGPDVQATCFQMRQCYFTHIKVSGAQQARVVERLSLTQKERLK